MSTKGNYILGYSVKSEGEPFLKQKMAMDMVFILVGCAPFTMAMKNGML